MANITVATFTPNGMLRDVGNAADIDFQAQRILADFADNTDQFWYTPDLVCPQEYLGTGVLKASIHFHSAGAGGGTDVRFGVFLEVTQVDGFSLETTNFDTENSVTKALASLAGRLAVATVTLANDGTPTALAAGSHFRALLKRDPDHGDDDAVGDIRVSTWQIWEDNS